MEQFLKKHWGKLLTFATIIAGGVYLHRRNRNEEQSGFAGETKKIQFTLNNRTPASQQVALFNARGEGSGTGNEAVGISPSMSVFNRSLLSEPKKVLDVSIRTNANQANQPIQKMCVDASGESAGETFYPQVSANQFQSGMVSVQPGNLVLDGACYLVYSIAPNTSVSMVMTYAVLGKANGGNGRRRKKK